VVRQGSAIIVNYLHKFGEAYRSQRLVLEALRLENFPRDCYRFAEHFGPLNPLPLLAVSGEHHLPATCCLLLAPAACYLLNPLLLVAVSVCHNKVLLLTTTCCLLLTTHYYLLPLLAVSVCHNKVAALPDDIYKLSTLEELLLDENELETFPEALGELVTLRKLSFCKNYFTAFPVQVSRCSRLQSLRFAENAMVRIHPGVGMLTLLTELAVDFDKIVEPSIDVLTQGCAAIVRYLGQIHQALTTFHLNLPNFKLVTFPPELVHTPTHPVPQAGRLLTVLLPGHLRPTPYTRLRPTPYTRLRPTRLRTVLLHGHVSV